MAGKEKLKRIYVIQEQGSLGCWELTGHAFTDDKQADAYVEKKTLEAIVEYFGHSPHRRKTLAEWAKRDPEEVAEMDTEKTVELLKSLPDELIHEFSEELQCGGFFSYEILSIYDGENPE